MHDLPIATPPFKKKFTLNHKISEVKITYMSDKT